MNLNLSNSLQIFKAFSSELRIRIFQLILNNQGITLSAISRELHLAPSTIAPHLHILNDAGLIRINDLATNGQRACFAADNVSPFLISLEFAKPDEPSVYRTSVPVGYYTDFSITAPCALASSAHFLGQLDDPRYFSQLQRIQADILWFTTGYVEYAFPVLIPANSIIVSLSFLFEIASEAPEHKDQYPSDITFSLDGTVLGIWTSPGDYGDRRGLLNPDWWLPFLNQYGLYKELIINSEGTFLDNEKLSDITIKTLNLSVQSPFKFRFFVDPDGKHPGGCTLFGKAFGDHPKDLTLEVKYYSP